MCDNQFIHTPKPSEESQRCCESESSSSCYQEVSDQLKAILQQESSHYAPGFNYLCSPNLPKAEGSSGDHVNECWRRKISEWAFEVVDHFGFDREVVSIALNYLDRVVAIKARELCGPISRRDFQLIAVTCLYLAIKVHGETDVLEGPRRKLKINAFVELSRGLFQVETLERMEVEILASLNWRVNPPTTVRIVATMLRLLPKLLPSESIPSNAANTIFEMSKYLTELSVCVSAFTFQFRPSTIAFASILCSFDALRGSLVLPSDVTDGFFDQIASITALTPSSQEVREVRSMLMELCPSMFEREDSLTPFMYVERGLESSAEGGKTSPVCVVDQMQDEMATRKRGRSAADY